ncbi:carbohydrate-binding module family 13 protein [Hypholoma sublateritium FD-334 SS-4]|uniref:Carbohydrate-binding module family 13 protein n=1 Tax=Hypholoma sublateritium (strain FD-334 SS-4) TaxID=945553 RepID=A0A0D2MM94_HYPSF|nr:carbohydrate-binding module family 13 protein [Hypholoma sublateritium FD-334 SS-4]
MFQRGHILLNARCQTAHTNADLLNSYIGQLLLQPGLNTAICLTAASNNDGAAVTIQPCTGSTAQKWTFAGNGQVTVYGNKCLDVTDGKNADGTKMQIWTCSTNNPNQKWDYNVWANTITWFNKGKCLDLTDASQASGNKIQIWGCNSGNINQVWDAGYSVSSLPTISQNGQYGTNNCGTGSDSASKCQTGWINSASDFCIWGPPYLAAIGDIETEAVAYCTKSGRGARTIPNGALNGVHFVKTPEYVQVTGVGNFTKINVPHGDSGGELDNRGADGKGNPIGGLLYGNSFGTNLQYHEWTSFLSDGEFCIRACVGARATALCNHVYDIMGCYWNIPASYSSGVFESCAGDAALPMGVYGTSTWSQGQKPTPSAHPAPASSNCAAIPTVSVSPALARRDIAREHLGLQRKRYTNPEFPGATPAPLL